jgi:hypothetical protein
LSLAHRPGHGPALANETHALMLFGSATRSGSTSSGSSSSSSTADRVLGAGDQVFAPLNAAVRLGDTNGTQLTLDPGGMLTVVESSATRRFTLRRGAVEARVRKLASGQRFIIDTADAEVEVHGTEFRVAIGDPESVPCAGVGPKAAVATRVSVTGGVVSVKWSGDEQRLLPGDEWPPRCTAAAAAPVTGHAEARPEPRTEPAAAPASASLPSRRHLSGGSTGMGAPPSTPSARAAEARAQRHAPPASVLEAQNDLFISAMRARRAGQNATALALFDRFMREYSDASLFESALVQRMRLLAATSDLRGASASASHYLARFPDGFARDEARTLLGARERP